MEGWGVLLLAWLTALTFTVEALLLAWSKTVVRSAPVVTAAETANRPAKAATATLGTQEQIVRLVRNSVEFGSRVLSGPAA